VFNATRGQFVTHLSVDEVRALILQDTDPRPSLIDRVLGQKSFTAKGNFWGRVSGSDFELRPWSTTGPFYLPVIHGRMDESEGGTIVRTACRLPRHFWSSALCFVVVSEALAISREGQVSLLPLLMLLLVSVGGYAFAFLPECRRAQQRLALHFPPYPETRTTSPKL
jgi:hypothetical protein